MAYIESRASRQAAALSCSRQCANILSTSVSNGPVVNYAFHIHADLIADTHLYVYSIDGRVALITLCGAVKLITGRRLPVNNTDNNTAAAIDMIISI